MLFNNYIMNKKLNFSGNDAQYAIAGKTYTKTTRS